MRSHNSEMTNYYNALASDAPLIVYVDVKSPYAFVAIKPIMAMETDLGLTFDWRPLTLDIPSYLGSAKKKDGKVVASNRSQDQWSGIKYAYRDARRYAERQGYILKGTEKIWDSSLINTAIIWVSQKDRGRLGDFFAAAYPPFWRRELDVEDLSVVEATVAEAGVSTQGLREFLLHDGKDIHDDLQSKLHPVGIYGVPTFVFGDEIMFGREHIPYVRWHLAGRNGTPPDIAYEI